MYNRHPSLLTFFAHNPMDSTRVAGRTGSLMNSRMLPELIAGIASRVDGADRHSLRMSARHLHRAIGEPEKDETVAVMLKHALKTKAMAVKVWCHRLPGPVQQDVPYMYQRSLSFSPRTEAGQQGKFRVYYQPGNIGHEVWMATNTILSHSATLQQCMSFLHLLCNINRAKFFVLITTLDASLSATPPLPGARMYLWPY